jgi:hypothetical protein
VDVAVREQAGRAERIVVAVIAAAVVRSTIDLRSLPEPVGDCDGIIYRQAVRYGGAMKSSPDGVSVRFSNAYSAVRCALAVEQDLRDVGLELSAGLHAGEADSLDGGMTEALAHVASRIRCVAKSSGVFASRAFGDFVVGAGVRFEDARGYYLDDALGEWVVLAVHSSS